MLLAEARPVSAGGGVRCPAGGGRYSQDGFSPVSLVHFSPPRSGEFRRPMSACMGCGPVHLRQMNIRARLWPRPSVRPSGRARGAGTSVRLPARPYGRAGRGGRAGDPAGVPRGVSEGRFRSGGGSRALKACTRARAPACTRERPPGGRRAKNAPESEGGVSAAANACRAWPVPGVPRALTRMCACPYEAMPGGEERQTPVMSTTRRRLGTARAPSGARRRRTPQPRRGFWLPNESSRVHTWGKPGSGTSSTGKAGGTSGRAPRRRKGAP